MFHVPSPAGVEVLTYDSNCVICEVMGSHDLMGSVIMSIMF